MVQLTLELLRAPATASEAGGAPSPRVFHVNARLSDSISEVGGFRVGKIFRLFGFCLQALWLRWRHGARVLYYVPAPPARTPVWRDWLVMALCRPWFPRLVFHWHAGGMSDWLETRARPWERWLTRQLLGGHSLSIVLRPFNRRDGEYLGARAVLVVPNALPDPCADFEAAVLPVRQQRAVARRAVAARGGTEAGRVVRVLYLSLVRQEKGIFDALEAVAMANARLRGGPFRIELTVAGEFASPAEQRRFEERIGQPDLAGPPAAVEYVGFASGAAKDRLFRESDCLCFPTLLPEGFPVTLAEAMAYGLPVLTSDHRQLPEILPAGYCGVFRAGDAKDLAARLVEFTQSGYDDGLRRWFLEHYTTDRFRRRLCEALSSV